MIPLPYLMHRGRSRNPGPKGEEEEGARCNQKSLFSSLKREEEGPCVVISYFHLRLEEGGGGKEKSIVLVAERAAMYISEEEEDLLQGDKGKFIIEKRR